MLHATRNTDRMKDRVLQCIYKYRAKSRDTPSDVLNRHSQGCAVYPLTSDNPLPSVQLQLRANNGPSSSTSAAALRGIRKFKNKVGIWDGGLDQRESKQNTLRHRSLDGRDGQSAGCMSVDLSSSRLVRILTLLRDLTIYDTIVNRGSCACSV